MKVISKLSIGVLILILGCTPKTPVDYLNESTEDFDNRMEWWRDAGFGMFIHWGPYAVPAGIYEGEKISGIGEWIMNSAQIPVADYELFARQFNPVEYNAEEWVKLARDAGMKYIIITSKHHDGFCLWDSRVSEYDVMDFSPIKRDLLKELKKACDKYDIDLGFYHSIMDWHHPQAQAPHYPTYNNSEKINPEFEMYYENYLKPQLQELVKNYDPKVLWFDGEWIPEFTHDQGLDLYQHVRSLKPEIIINNRVDKGRQGMQGMTRDDMQYAGDFGTPEQEILETASAFDWESCMTMNDTWGYKSWDQNWKSTETLVHNLVDIAAKGGNYLLNIGPMANGLIPDESITRLKEMGDWMSVNGDIIYGSRPLDNFMEHEHLYFISDKDHKHLYAVTTRWPGTSLKMKYIKPDPGSEIFLLGYPHPLEWSDLGADGIEIMIPDDLQDEQNRPCAYAWVFKMEGDEVTVVAKPIVQYGDLDNPEKVLFSEDFTLRLSSPTEGSSIYFSLDGTPPDTSAMRYKNPVTVRESALLRAIAVKDGAIHSPELKVELSRITTFKAIEFSTPFSEKYTAQGPLTLGNGKTGSPDFFDMEWLGWEGEDFEALIDMGQTVSVKQLTAGFLNNIQSWIFLPVQVEFYVSEDGTTYRMAGTVENEMPVRNEEKFRKDFILPHDGPVRYIKVRAESIKTCPDWHPGAGEKAWLFIDEITIE